MTDTQGSPSSPGNNWDPRCPVQTFAMAAPGSLKSSGLLGELVLHELLHEVVGGSASVSTSIRLHGLEGSNLRGPGASESNKDIGHGPVQAFAMAAPGSLKPSGPQRAPLHRAGRLHQHSSPPLQRSQDNDPMAGCGVEQGHNVLLIRSIELLHLLRLLEVLRDRGRLGLGIRRGDEVHEANGTRTTSSRRSSGRLAETTKVAHLTPWRLRRRCTSQGRA